ncbi:12702_t:CDS:2 [Entrophospora sp. SA101]|nr:12702_t:CDS:2 [Entrophospora sp. SA101]
MANMDDLKLLPDDQEAREWIYKAKANGFMLFYDCSDFERVELVENSADSILKKAVLRPLQKVVTLSKSKFNTQFSLRHVLLELQKLHKASVHDNVLGYVGLTQEPNASNIVTVISEYADYNLRDYLSSSDLSWNEKFKLAKQLTKESKKTLAQYFEQIPYLDPQHLKNPKEFMRDEIISDIYSLGVLFWEISSQKIPFEEFSNEPCKLCYLIVYENHRENSVPDTPKFYEDLYKECWQFERDSRPKTGDVWEL